MINLLVATDLTVYRSNHRLNPRVNTHANTTKTTSCPIIVCLRDFSYYYLILSYLPTSSNEDIHVVQKCKVWFIQPTVCIHASSSKSLNKVTYWTPPSFSLLPLSGSVNVTTPTDSCHCWMIYRPYACFMAYFSGHELHNYTVIVDFASAPI